ncbi:hypothetical protein TURU_138706 [Turdus rufiventris]|nr:hypothetical protein TURU_138706 [Turdus rufiventris]
MLRYSEPLLLALLGFTGTIRNDKPADPRLRFVMMQPWVERPKVVLHPIKGLSVFTDAGKQSEKAACVWKNEQVGVPFPDGFDNVTFDKYWPYDDHHLSPTPPPRHQTYIDNFKVDQSDLEELEILGSLTMDTCYYFHFKGDNSLPFNITPYHLVYSNVTFWCHQTHLILYEEPYADHLNKLPILFPRGIWLICGDRTWPGNQLGGSVLGPLIRRQIKRREYGQLGHQQPGVRDVALTIGHSPTPPYAIMYSRDQ